MEDEMMHDVHVRRHTLHPDWNYTIAPCRRSVQFIFQQAPTVGRTRDHGWLVKFLEHRIADRRVRLIQKWLNVGVLEDGTRTWSETARRKGSASPLLANVYLHYVFDLWVQRWRRRRLAARSSSCAMRTTAPRHR